MTKVRVGTQGWGRCGAVLMKVLIDEADSTRAQFKPRGHDHRNGHFKEICCLDSPRDLWDYFISSNPSARH